MDDYRYNGNVIEIIGGDNPIDDQLVSGNELNYDGIQSPKSGSEPPTSMNQSMEIRERTSILLTPGSYGDDGASQNGGATGNGGLVTSNSTVKPVKWKTRLCNKWEQTSFCPFGSKCHFAHGTAELQRYGGGVVDQEANPNNNNNNNQGLTGSSMARVVAPPGSSSGVQRPVKKWKGPDKISLIYGDWIDDLE